jgi:hypothetical protein
MLAAFVIAQPAKTALQNNEIDWWEQPLADLLPKLAADKTIARQIDQPWGRTTEFMLKKIGMNVDLQETDWGTVVQRRSGMELVE